MFSPGQSRVRKGASILNIGTSGSDSPGKECFNEAYSHSPSSSRSPGHFPSSSGKKAGAPSSKFLVNSNSITHQAVASGQNTDMWSNTGRAGCGSNGSPSTTSSLRGQGQGHLAHRTADRTAGSKTVLAASSRANIGRHNLDISIASSNYHEENYQTASKNGLHAGRYTNPRSPESRSPHRHSSSAKRQRKSSHKDGFITSVSANQSSRTPKMKYSRSPRGVASPSSDVTAMATGTASASPNQDIRDQNKGAPLSPMRGYTGRQPSDVRELAVRRSFGQTESAVGKDEEPAAGGTWTGALFSPVLRLFGQDDPEGESPTKTTGNSVNVSPVNAAAAAVEQTQPASVERGNANPRQHAVHAVHAVSRPAAASHVNEHDSENKQQTRDSVEEVEDDEDYEEFNPYFFIKTLPPYKQAVPKPRPFMLPAKARNAPRLMLLLDLDETLVHCSVEPIPNPDLTFPVDFNGTRYEVYVRRRPHFQRFMEVVSKIFEVVVFTASQQVYAEKLLDILDPTGTLVSGRLYRDACVNVDGNYIKDLNIVGRDLRHTLLVDNSPHAFGFQVDNGVPIESWFDDDSDTELLKLLPFLQSLLNVPDVRPVLRKQFRVHQLISNARDTSAHRFM